MLNSVLRNITVLCIVKTYTILQRGVSPQRTAKIVKSAVSA